MNVTAFAMLTLVLSGYVLLDGYDLGVGAMHLFVARTDKERGALLAAIGPFWSGNEVMLIAAGAMLFALFPRAYAAAFSGFYLPFMLLLWLLMGRGMSIELRNHFASDLWHGFWDVTFAVCSALLAFILGVSLGNVLRGVPLDAQGYFAGTFGSLLNGYAILVGVFALMALALHGLAFIGWRQGELSSRAAGTLRILLPVVIALYAIATWATLHVHPVHAGAILWIAPAAGVLALAGVSWFRDPTRRFVASAVFLLTLMISAAATIFPYLLPAYPIGSGGLDVVNAAPGNYALRTGVSVFGAGLAIVLLYSSLAMRRVLARSRVTRADKET